MEFMQTFYLNDVKSISENRKVLIKNAVEMGEMFCNDHLFKLLEVKEESRNLLKMRWKEKMTFEKIASVYNISYQRVIALYSKTINELSSNINIITKNILTQKEDNHKLKVSKNTPLMEIFPISTKKLKLFHLKNIYTISDVLQCSKKELLKMSGIGVKTVWDLENSLEEKGYYLRK
jgi:DNA-directed RNA polymerase alpha subunit